jgi:hypothetical protein
MPIDGKLLKRQINQMHDDLKLLANNGAASAQPDDTADVFNWLLRQAKTLWPDLDLAEATSVSTIAGLLLASGQLAARAEHAYPRQGAAA